MANNQPETKEQIQVDIDKLTERLMQLQKQEGQDEEMKKLIAQRAQLRTELAQADFDSKHPIIGGIFKNVPIFAKKVVEYANNMDVVGSESETASKKRRK